MFIFTFDDTLNPSCHERYQISREMFGHYSETFFSCSLKGLCCSTFLFKIPWRGSIEFNTSNILTQAKVFTFFLQKLLYDFWQCALDLLQMSSCQPDNCGAIYDCHLPNIFCTHAVLYHHTHLSALLSGLCIHCGSPDQVHAKCSGPLALWVEQIYHGLICPKNVLPVFIRLLFVFFRKVSSCSIVLKKLMLCIHCLSCQRNSDFPLEPLCQVCTCPFVYQN